MKKIIFLILALCTYYVAGMYHLIPLLILFVAQVAVFIFSFILSFYFKLTLFLKLQNRSYCAQKSAEFPCFIKAENKGILPISRFRAKVSFHYQQFPMSGKKTIYGGIDERAESSLDIRMKAVYCGLFHLRLNKIRVYDYLSLFSNRIRHKDEMKIAVYPMEKALNFSLRAFKWSERKYQKQQKVQKLGDDLQEIRMIREYQNGDSIRHIHWNHSAKTQEFWVKEYELEPDSSIELLLDVRTEPDLQIEQLDAFYEVLSATVLGLLKTVTMVRIFWYDNSRTALISRDIYDIDQCRDMLFDLYQMGFADLSKDIAFFKEMMVQDDSVLMLDLTLGLYSNNELLHRFSVEEFEEEIEQMHLVI